MLSYAPALEGEQKAKAAWRAWDRVDGGHRSGLKGDGGLSGMPPMPMPHDRRESRYSRRMAWDCAVVEA